jgi:uncharacterized protein YdaU (DUF1376 family)
MSNFLVNEFHPLRLTRFDFDVVDFLTSPDVASMSAAEVGQYVLLLCAAWVGGKNATLPDDSKLLARLARAPRGVSPRVMNKFPQTRMADGVLVRHNLRLSKEWNFACERAQRRHEKAQKAAKIGWGQAAHGMLGACSEHASGNAQAMPGNAPGTVSASVPDPKEKPVVLAENRSRTRNRKTRPQADPLFAKFWADYPRKIRRKEAEAGWGRLSEADRLAVLEILPAFIGSDGWQEQSGKFVPAPDRFLGEGRWKTPPLKGQNNANNTRKPTNAFNSQRGTVYSAGKSVLPGL